MFQHEFYLNQLPCENFVTWVYPRFLMGFVLLDHIDFCVVFCQSLFVVLFFFLLAIVLPVLLLLWSLYCLSFFELRFLITPLATFLKIYLYTFQNTFLVFGLFVLKLLSIFNFLTFWPKYYCTETSYQYIHYWPDTNLSIYNLVHHLYLAYYYWTIKS